MFLIVAFVLLFVLPWPWSLLGFAVGLMCFMGELAFWNGRVKNRRAAVGAQTLIGMDATVVEPCRPTGQVRVDGATWAARCDAGADRDETVKVVGREKLTLLVEKPSS
jgi:membrane protein implicated in regulation of membrane protease activity